MATPPPTLPNLTRPLPNPSQPHLNDLEVFWPSPAPRPTSCPLPCAGHHMPPPTVRGSRAHCTHLAGSKARRSCCVPCMACPRGRAGRPATGSCTPARCAPIAKPLTARQPPTKKWAARHPCPDNHLTCAPPPQPHIKDTVKRKTDLVRVHQSRGRGHLHLALHGAGVAPRRPAARQHYPASAQQECIVARNTQLDNECINVNFHRIHGGWVNIPHVSAGDRARSRGWGHHRPPHDADRSLRFQDLKRLQGQHPTDCKDLQRPATTSKRMGLAREFS
jgi:hypothetical protein